MTEIETLLADARRAGYSVSEGPAGHISVLRCHARTGRILRGVTIYPNGTAIRADVDLAAAVAIRGVANIRKALGV